MSSATLVFQNVKWPVFKVFSVLLLFFILDYETREGVFTSEVAVPFLLLLIAPILFAAVRRENPIWALIASSVPAGVAVGAFHLIEPLITMESAEGAVASALVFSPVAYGLVLSYLLRVVAPAYKSKPEATGALGFFMCLAVTACCVIAYVAKNSSAAEVYLNVQALKYTLAVSLCCLAFNHREQTFFGEVMARAGKLACLLAAVYAVTQYTSYAALGDMRGIGPTLVASQTLLAFGALVVIAASASGIRPPTDRELLTRDWHLTEAYVFITLIIFPPQTLLELMSTSGVAG